MTGTVRSLRLLAAVVLTTALTIGVSAPITAQDDGAILEEMIALEEAKLDAWFQNDVSAYLAEMTDETTYFDTNAGKKLTGDEAREFFETVYAGNIPPLAYELTDTSAAVRDDLVVFTFHIDMSDPESEASAGRWLVSKVLEQTADGWKSINTHFSLIPPPAQEAPVE